MFSKKIFSRKNLSLVISSCFLFQNSAWAANDLEREARVKYLLERAKAREAKLHPAKQVTTVTTQSSIPQTPVQTTTQPSHSPVVVTPVSNSQITSNSGATTATTTTTTSSSTRPRAVRNSSKTLSTSKAQSGDGKVLSTRYRESEDTAIKIPDMPETTHQESSKGKVLSTDKVTTTQSSTQEKLERQAREAEYNKLRQERIAQEKAARAAQRQLQAEQAAKEKAAREVQELAEKQAKAEQLAKTNAAKEEERKLKAEQLAQAKAAKEAERKLKAEQLAQAKAAKEAERKLKAEQLAQAKAAKEAAKEAKAAKLLEEKLAKEAELKAKAEQKIAELNKAEAKTVEQIELLQAEKIEEAKLLEATEEKLAKETAATKEAELAGIVEPLDENENIIAGLDPLEIKPLTEEDKTVQISKPIKLEDTKPVLPDLKPSKEEKKIVAEAKPEIKPEPAKVEEVKKIETEKQAAEIAKAEPEPEKPSVRTELERENDYQMLVKKSLKSLEEDSWNDVKYNMKQNLDYFTNERKNYSTDPKIEQYYKVSLAFSKFAEAGLELDQGDFADFEEAESLYLDSQDILDEVQKNLKKEDPNNKVLLDTIGAVKKYIGEELQYIEEMVGIE